MGTTSSGLGGVLTAAKETTYGTAVVTTRAFEFESEDLNVDPSFAIPDQLKNGRLYLPQTGRQAMTANQGAGPINMTLPLKGLGLFFDMLNGDVSTPVQQMVTAAYLQSYKVGLTEPTGKSLTIQIVRPDSSGTKRAHTFLGSKITGWSMSCQKNDFLKASFNVDFQKLDTSIAVATPAYPASQQFLAFKSGAITVDATPYAYIEGFSLSPSQGMKTDRYFLGNAGVKQEPLPNAKGAASLTLDAEFHDLTLRDKFLTGATAAVVLTFTGPIIASTFAYQVTLTMPYCGVDDAQPAVAGPDVLSLPVSCNVLDPDDATTPPILLTYMSTDITA